MAFLQSSVLIELWNKDMKSTIKVTFEGASSVVPQGKGELRHSSNVVHGSDPSHWKSDVPSYQAIVYEGLYPGIDLVYTTPGEGIKYEFLVQPFMDPNVITVRYHDAMSLGTDGDGRLLVETEAGTLKEEKPYSYQVVGGEELEVPSGYVVDGNAVSLKLGEYDPSFPLVIDPLIYSSFLGGGDHDHGRVITLDREGSVYIAGITSSSDFPTTSGCFDDTYNDGYDIVVSKLSDDGSRIEYSTFIGGTGDDRCEAMAIDQENNVYVTGVTRSADFPTTPGCFDGSLDGGSDAFVLKLSPDGGDLLYSTFIGGENNEQGNDLALDGQGCAVVTGTTHSGEFPTSPDAYDDSYNEWGDVFICKLSRDGSELGYSSYIGGGDLDHAAAVSLDDENDVYVTGATESSNFPTTPGCFDGSKSKGKDIFVLKLDMEDSCIIYSTFIGNDRDDSGRDIVVDGEKNAVVTGETASPGFPTTAGAFDGSFNGGLDAFVLKLDAEGSDTEYSSFIGGGGDEAGVGLVLDPDNNAYFTGTTNSSDFPVTPGCYDGSLNGSDDAFICKLDHDGSSLFFSTFLGGNGSEAGHGITLGPFNDVYIAGETNSSDFPIGSACADGSYNGRMDGFLVRFSLFEAMEHVNIDYVIVTDPANVDALVPLADWKTQKGVPAHIFTTDSIYANFSGSDEAEKIRHFVKYLEQTRDIDYLLLAGDVDTVPTRLAYDTFDDEYIATDSYFSFLNGSWDDNGDGKFGDFDHDNVTWLPDVYVGRLPVSDIANLTSLVQNILDYERDPVDGEWFSSALFSAAYSNYDEDRDHDDVMDMAKTDKAKVTYTIETRFVPENLSIERLYEIEGLDPSDYAYDRGLSLENFSDSLDAGHSLVILSGHGSKTSTYRRVWKYDRDGDGLNDRINEETSYEYFNMDVHPSNGKKLPFFYIEACKAGWFDDSSDCLAEHVIKNISIGVVASSRASFYQPAWYPGENGGGLNQGLNYRFWEQFFGGCYSPGEALYESKEDYVRDRSIRVQDIKNLYNYNLFGDPEVPVWTSAPADLTVEFPKTVVPREESLRFSVSDQFDKPVENATVTLMNDHIYLTGVSNESGELIFQLTEEINSSLLLTVVKHNFLPFQDQITVEYPPEIQDVSYSGETVFRDHTMLIFVNASDDKDEEAELEHELEFRAPSGTWTAVGTNYYDPNDSVWVAEFTPGLWFETGNYSIRTRLRDSDNGLSEWGYAENPVLVMNNPPEVVDLDVGEGYVYRNRTVTIYANGTDTEDEDSWLDCEFQYRPETSEWTVLEGSFSGDHWNAELLPSSVAKCGFVDLRVRFMDRDGDFGEWFEVADMVEVRNNIPVPLDLGSSLWWVCRTDSLTIYAEGSDEEDDSSLLECLVQYRAPGGMWRELTGYVLSGEGWEVTFTPEGDAELGTYDLRLKFSDRDGGESHWLEKPAVIEVLNRVPTAEITLLSPNPANESEIVHLSGNASDDGGVRMFHWSSDIDGFLSSERSFSTGFLSNGTHTIALKVRDDNGAWSEAARSTIVVNGLPRVHILGIGPNPSLAGEDVEFAGEGIDDGRIACYVWRTGENEFYNNTWSVFSSSELPAGTHTIWLRVRDDHGAWSGETSKVLIIHHKPVAHVDSIPPNPGYEGQSIEFRGHGTDDGTIDDYYWYSDLDGELSDSDEFSTSMLSVGVHRVYFRVRDDHGIWSDEESILVIINPREDSPRNPSIVMESPDNNSVVSGTVIIQGHVDKGGAGVKRLEVSINGAEWVVVDGSDSWSYEWDTRTLQDGEYEIRVRSFDGETYSAERSWTVRVENRDDDAGEENRSFLIIGLIGASFGAAITVVFLKRRE